MELAFFSYSRSDKNFALKLAGDLRKNGINLWFDLFDIPAGALWDVEIEKALCKCDSFVVLLSPNSVNSKHVQDELSYAIEENKKIIPLKISSCDVPFRIRRLQYIDFEHDYNEGLKAVIKSLEEVRRVATIKSEDVTTAGRSGEPGKFSFKKKNLYYLATLLIASIFIISGWLLSYKPKNYEKEIPKEIDSSKRQNPAMNTPDQKQITMPDHSLDGPDSAKVDSSQMTSNIIKEKREPLEVVDQAKQLQGKWRATSKTDYASEYPFSFDFSGYSVTLDFSDPYNGIAHGKWYFKNNLLYIDYSWPNIFPQEGVYKIILLDNDRMKLSGRKYGIGETIQYEKY